MMSMFITSEKDACSLHFSLLDIEPELNMDLEDNSPYQEGEILEMYKRPDKSYFLEPQELESLINTGR